MEAAVTAWVFAGLVLWLPVDLQHVESSAKVVNPVRPPSKRELDQMHCFLRGEGNRYLSLMWWSPPQPPYPGGPMVAAAEWDVPFIGQTARVAETSTFMGIQGKQVLVSSTVIQRSNARLWIHAGGLTRDEFNSILSTAKLMVEGKFPLEAFACKRAT